jgi:predicted acyltransferase (DUF342 family)
MSWKKYGGTNKLDKINNISVNTVVTDKFTLKNFYVGDWDICGGLRAKDDTNLMRDLYVAGDIFGKGDINIDGSMNVLNTNIVGNVFVAENAFVRQNIFMDLSGGTMLHGENRRFGFGTVSPQATIDISGDLVQTIDIHTSTATNKNVIARNVTNQGVTVNIEPSRAYIDFYVDNSINLATENYNGRLVYEEGGNFTIDVSNIVKFKPRVIFSQDLSKNLLADERVIIYGNPLADVPYIPTIYGDTTFKTGTAAYLVAGDNSSNAFFRLGTEKGSGLTLGGGYFPGDKIMGVIALTDASNTKYPAMNIISGNLISNLKTSIAVNKYNVSTINGANRYAMDVNGPMKLAHQELIVAADVLFEVYRTVFYGNIGYAVGSPLTANPYTQYFLKTVDGGYTWTSSRIVGSNGNPNPNNLEDTAHFFSAIYAISESDILIAGDNRYFFRSTNGGQTWSTISFTGTGVNDGINITAIFLSDTRLIVGTGDNTGTSDGIILNSTTWNVGTISSGGAFYISTGLSAVNAIHGFGLDTIIVGVGGIVPYRTSTSIFGTRVATTSTFNDVKVLNDGINHVVAVGADVIWYAHDLSWNGTAYTVTWNQAASFSGVLRSLQIFDTMRAIAVGDNGLIMYSIDGYATWNTVTQGMLDNSSLITGIKLSTISILNANDFVVSGIIQDFVKPNTLGRTKLFNLYAPYFLNRPNHSVLEASGNMVMSGDLQINDAGQLLSNMTYFNILPTVVQEINIGNTVVGGNTNVKANLDVTLDITGHQNMLLYGDASLNSRVFIGGDASLNSNLYVVKDSSFNGRIFVGGDASLNSKLFVAGDASFNSRVFVGNDVSLNSKLFVAGDASFNSRVFVGNDVSLNSKLFVAGDASFNSRVFVGNDVSLNSKLFVSGDASFNSRVFVGNDVSLNSKLFVSGDVSFNSRVFVGNDVSLNSKLFVSGDVSFNSKLFVGGDVSLNSKLFVGGDASFNSKLFVGGDVSFNSKLFVGGDVSFNSKLFVGGDVSFNSKLFVSGDVSFNSKLFVRGDVSFNSKLFVRGDVSFNSKLFVGGDVSLNSKLFVGGDASFNSKLFVGGDASFNSKLFVGSDVSLNSKLFVKGDVSFNTKLNVVGDVSFNSNLYVAQKTTIFDLSAQNADFTGIVRANTFDSRPGTSLLIGGTNAGNITIQTSTGSTNVLTLGDAGSNVRILGNLTLPGSVTSTNINNLEIKNKTILLNDEAVGNNVSTFSGLQIRDDNIDNKGYFLTNGRSDGFLFKSSQNANRVNLDVSGLRLTNGMTQGFVVLKATSPIDISADYTITTGFVNISDIQQLDASLNRRVERTSATTATTQVVGTNLLTNGLYVGKTVDSYIANSQMDILGNAFISRLGLGTSAVNTNYTLEVNNNARIVNNLDVSNSLTVQNNINLYGMIVQW